MPWLPRLRSNLQPEKDLSLVEPVTGIPQDRHHQDVLRNRAEIAQELEVLGEVPQPAVEPRLYPNLSERVDKDGVHPHNQEWESPLLEVLYFDYPVEDRQHQN